MNIKKTFLWSTVGGVAYYYLLRWLRSDEGSGGTQLPPEDSGAPYRQETPAPELTIH